MDTKGNKVYYKDQEVKFDMTHGYYFIDTEQGAMKLCYEPNEDRWYEGSTMSQSCQYCEVTPAFIFANGPRFLELQNSEHKNVIGSLKILRNLNADCALVGYTHDTESPEVNDQARVLNNFCQTLSPGTLDYFNQSLNELCYTVAPHTGSNFVDQFFLETLMDIFEEGTRKQDWYDVDMFVHDVMDKFEVCFGTEAQVRFQSALIDFVRKHEPYEFFGSSGLFIIVAELTKQVSDNF